MRGHNICFNGEILKIIPKLSLLLLIWSTEASHVVAKKLELKGHRKELLSEEENSMVHFQNTAINSLHMYFIYNLFSCLETVWDGPVIFAEFRGPLCFCITSIHASGTLC